MITHSVIFRLKHPAGSAEEQKFLDGTLVLKAVPGVRNFRRFRQVSPKTDFRFGVAMEFADQAAYAGYDAHPDHVAFVRDLWVPEVEAFLEIDHEDL